jgi:hypothetical protein
MYKHCRVTSRLLQSQEIEECRAVFAELRASTAKQKSGQEYAFRRRCFWPRRLSSSQEVKTFNFTLTNEIRVKAA